MYMKEVSKIPLYSYFYPLTTQCTEHNQRCSSYGVQPTDETILCQSAKPLFEGHRQPNKYTVDLINSTWDDMDTPIMQQQIDLAQEHGVDGFIFDTYVGCRDGRVIREKTNIIDKSFLECQIGRTAFASMMILGSPRAVLPVAPLFEEPDRYFDRTKETVRAIIDYSAQNHWEHANYIHILGRPYISLFTSDMRKSSARDASELDNKQTVEYMKEYSLEEYKIEPYVVAVALNTKGASGMINGGADAMTGYAFLADFDDSFSRPIQDYEEQVKYRVHDWRKIRDTIDVPYVPPLVVGWDASPRGDSSMDTTFDKIKGNYPFTPIITGCDAEKFGTMYIQQQEYLRESVNPAERYTPVTAWNEITEGSALLPRITDEGIIDNTYLEKIKLIRKHYGC